MKQYKIIDTHAHIFPEKIASKAVDSIGKFYSLSMRYGGTTQELISSGSKIGVLQYLVFGTATTVEQVKPINDFIYSECLIHPEFIGLGTLHPDMKDYEAEIKRIKAFGFKGVKLHPDFQRFYIDEPKMYAIYAALEREKLLLLCHVGDLRNDFSNPKRLAAVAQEFTQLKIIAPHFGGWKQWKEAAQYLRLLNVYFDTSSSLYILPKGKVLELINCLSYTKFFFGTDFPMWDHQEELKRLLELGLEEYVVEDILYNNFQQLLG